MITQLSPGPDTDHHPQAVDHAVSRLAAEFPDRHRTTVATTVRQCRRDLDGVPPGALPELLERLARQRLRASA